MKINNLRINSFGKLTDKDIKLSNEINLVVGDNEAGKSTMQKFISCILYGASKNKNGKEISDFDKFKPWYSDEFSGKIEYTLDNGESYEIYRDFKKKNPIIYNSQKEDISKDYLIDKSKGIEFFVEQTGIDEETFYSTAITEQEGIKLSKSSQSSIIQKISNLVSSGDDSISFKKTLEKINRNQNEEVGTSRTSQRPLNVVENKIYKLNEQKKNLDTYKNRIEGNSSRKERLLEDQKKTQYEKEFLKEMKTILEDTKIKDAEINFNKNLEKEYNQKIKELNEQIAENREKTENKIETHRNYYLVLSLCIISFVILMFVNPYKIINFALLIPIFLIIYKKYKDEKVVEVAQISSTDKTKIMNEIEVLKKNREAQRNEAKSKEGNLEKEIEEKKQKLAEKYEKLLTSEFIEKNLARDYDAIVRRIDRKEDRINTIKFELQTMEATAEDITKKLDDLSNIEEELQDAEDEKKELLSLNNSYNIAKECLEKAYEKVKSSISPRFIKNLSDIISKISNDRYNNIVLTDDEGLKIEIENGSYMPVSRLSVGTIDQMYISLRLSALDEISNETMPIILDEAFAYFDNERLENILRYINANFKDNQIIIFTCSNREKEVLDKLKIKYNIATL